MALSRTKLKKELLEKNFEEAEHTGGREDDPRVLPYYNLKEGEKLRVLFQPDADGNLFRYFRKHGPNLRMPGAGSIDCIYHSSGIECPACKKGFEIMNEVSKDEGKKWMPKDYYVAQCVVIDAPFELPERPEDHDSFGNEMWLVYLPYKVFKKIKEDYREGLVGDPFEEVFVFKKTENKGGQASYESSFFERNKPDAIEEIFSAFEDAVVEPYDIQDGKIMPEPATREEVQEWVEKVEGMMEKNGKSPEGGEKSSGSKLRDSVGDRLKSKKEVDTASDDGDNTPDGGDSDQEESPRARLGKGSLRDRIRR